MRISPINNTDTRNFKGAGSKIGKALENVAATLPTKSSPNRKTISIELHNTMVKLTAYRVAILCAALFGFGGFKIADKRADKDSKSFANSVQLADIDTEAPFEIEDVNHDGHTDLILQKKDGSKMILDLKNSDVFVESSGFKAVK